MSILREDHELEMRVLSDDLSQNLLAFDERHPGQILAVFLQDVEHGIAHRPIDPADGPRAEVALHERREVRLSRRLYSTISPSNTHDFASSTSAKSNSG